MKRYVFNVFLPEAFLAFTRVLVVLGWSVTVVEVLAVIIRTCITTGGHAIFHVCGVYGRAYHVQIHSGNFELAKHKNELLVKLIKLFIERILPERPCNFNQTKLWQFSFFLQTSHDKSNFDSKKKLDYFKLCIQINLLECSLEFFFFFESNY